MSDGLRAILANAKANAVIGTGVLTVDGHEVAILHNVDYTGVVKTYDHVLGANGGRVEARFATEMDATLKAGYADVLGHVELFTLNSASAPSSGPLPVHTATYAGANGITITFPQCNIIPSGIKCVQGEWVSSSIEIKAVGQTLPTISDTPGTWTGGTGGTGGELPGAVPMTTLGDMVYGSTGGVPTRLAGDTSGAGVFLTAQAVDGEAQPPAWHALEVADIPTLPYTKVDGFDARVRTSRLDQMGLPAGNVGMNSFRVTSLANGTAPGDAVNRAQLDAVTLASLGGVPATRTVAGHALSSDVTLTTADVPDATGRRYVTDAQKASLASLGGTNTGDETAARLGALIDGATAKTAPVDADMVGLMDSEASSLLKKLSWSGLKAALKSYFDALYTLANLGGVPTTRQVAGHALSADVTLSASDVGLGSVTNDAQVKRTEMGAAGGVATLDSGGALTTGQVPSDVTRQGNTFNGASQLVQTTAEGKLPALDGSLLTGLAGSGGTASSTTVDASGFSGNLSTTDTDVQTALATIDAMTVSGSGMANPMTTTGDLIAGGTDGAPGRLGVGTTGQVLTVVSGAPAWADATGGGGGGGGPVLIQEIVLTSAAASVTFSDIPQTYRHLRIEYIARTDLADGPTGNFDAIINGDTGANYSYLIEYRSGNPSAGGVVSSRSANRIQYIGASPGAYSDIPAGYSGQGTIRALYYATATGFHRRLSSLHSQRGREGFDSEVGQAQVSGAWASTAPITSLQFIPTAGGNFVAGCRFALYGEA